jgi:hypothetical protein
MGDSPGLPGDSCSIFLHSNQEEEAKGHPACGLCGLLRPMSKGLRGGTLVGLRALRDSEWLRIERRLESVNRESRQIRCQYLTFHVVRICGIYCYYATFLANITEQKNGRKRDLCLFNFLFNNR